jgi:hypothetical protein
VFIRKKVYRRGVGRVYSYFYLVKSIRDKGKIKQRVVKYLGRKVTKEIVIGLGLAPQIEK